MVSPAAQPEVAWAGAKDSAPDAAGALGFVAYVARLGLAAAVDRRPSWMRRKDT